jgi:hypothetical protein
MGDEEVEERGKRGLILSLVVVMEMMSCTILKTNA